MTMSALARPASRPKYVASPTDLPEKLPLAIGQVDVCSGSYPAGFDRRMNVRFAFGAAKIRPTENARGCVKTLLRVCRRFD